MTTVITPTGGSSPAGVADPAPQAEVADSHRRRPRRGPVRGRRWSISTPLVALVFVALLPVVVMVVFRAFEARDAGERQVAGEVEQAARLAAADQDGLLASTAALVQVLARAPDAAAGGPACKALLQEVHADNVRLTAIGVAGRDGTPRCMSIEMTGPLNIADRSYFQDAVTSGGRGIGEYQIGRVTGKPVIGVAQAIVEPDGEVQGVVFATLDLTRPLSVARDLELPTGSALTVFDHKGTILARWPHDAAFIGVEFPQMVASGRLVGPGIVRTGVDGVDRIYGVATLAHGGEGKMSLAVGVPVSTAHADGDQDLRLGLAWLAMVATVAALGAITVGRSAITRPVRRLSTVAHELASGDLTARTGPVRTRELAELATDLDTMASSIEQREAQLLDAERRAVESRYQGLLDVAADGVVVVDEGGRVRLFGPGAEALFALAGERVAGRPLGELAARPGALAEERSEVEWRRGDGSTFVADTTVSPGRDGMRTVILRDITARKDAEAALAERNRELELANKELELFAYVASHDLSEPLRAVAGFTQLLKRRYAGRLDDQADQYIDFAVDGCTRMQQLIDDLLAYSRVGRIETDLAEVDVGRPLQVALARLNEQVAATGASIEIGELATVRANENLLVQVFQNLLANALKFRHADRPPVIAVSSRRGDNGWEFMVADNGIGIPPKHRDRVFQMFKRLHTIDQYPGTGIGLALCRKVVDFHGGDIWIDDTPGGGTTFHFTIPDVSE